MPKKITCLKCGMPVPEMFEQAELCEQHYREYLYERWHPKNGVDGIINFAFECFPDIFEKESGVAYFHREMLEMILDGLNNKRYTDENLYMIKAYRSSSKSTWMNIGICSYAIAYNLKKFIVLMNESQTKAINTSMYRLKEALSSEWFQFVFGDMSLKEATGKTREKVWNRALFVCNNQVNTMVAGIGLNQSMRSKVSRTVRPDLLLADDMESEINTVTPEIRQKNRNIFFNQDLPAMDIRGMVVVMQTPVHPDGLYYEISQHPKFKCVEAPLYRADKDGVFLRDENNNMIPQWPERHPLEWCKAKEDFYRSSKDGIRGFNQEFLLLLVTDETRRIQEDSIQYCKIETKRDSGVNWSRFLEVNGDRVDDPEPRMVTRMMAVDPATSLRGEACNTAGIVTDVHYNHKKVVIDYFSGKYTGRDILKKAGDQSSPYKIEFDLRNVERRGIIGETFRMANKWMIDVLIIENVGAYEQLVQEIEEVYRNWYTTQTNHRFKIIRYNPVGKEAKMDRIYTAIIPDFDMRRFYLSAPMQDLKDELTNFGAWKTVDLVDALHMTIAFAEVPQHKTLFDQKKGKMIRRKKVKTLEEIFYA